MRKPTFVKNRNKEIGEDTKSPEGVFRHQFLSFCSPVCFATVICLAVVAHVASILSRAGHTEKHAVGKSTLIQSFSLDVISF